jgi:NADPH2:quinone reductase
MRRVVYDVNGGPDVLRLDEAPLPEPGPGEVRVRVHRSGVNPTDWKSRRGSGDGQRVDPPQTPNQDGSGVIDAVGTGVDSGRVGQRIWIWEAAHQRPYGTAAEATVVPERHAVPLPDDASFDLGAALGVPFVTAHRCLTVAEEGPHHLGPGALAGHTILVTGGAGAVGNAAIQLGRWSDATVITTVSSPEKAQLAAAAGADHVINYRQQDVVEEVRKIVPHGVHTIVDVSAAQNVGSDVQVLAPNGAVAIYADGAGDEVTLPIRPLMMRNARWQFVLLYTVRMAAKEQAVEDITLALRQGAIRVGDHAGMPLHHFSLEQTADAHVAVQDGVVGKVLIDIA